MRITAVCTCGAEWSFEGRSATEPRMDARAAIMFAEGEDRLRQVKAYNLHLTDKRAHPKGR